MLLCRHSEGVQGQRLGTPTSIGRTQRNVTLFSFTRINGQ